MIEDRIKERIEKVIKAESLTSTRFADAIGVQRSNISHILSGRNKPSLDFIQKVLTTFSSLNSDWLLFGRGSMYNDGKSKNEDAKQSLFSGTENPEEEKAGQAKNTDTSVKQETNEAGETSEQSAGVFGQIAQNQSLDSDKKITRIIIIFQDGTFKEYTPG